MKRGLSEICYGFFSTLANPTRLAILEALKENGEMNVSGLAEELEQEQSMISHNLKILERCNLIYSERRGKRKLAFLNRDTVEPLFEIVENHAETYCDYPGACKFAR